MRDVARQLRSDLIRVPTLVDEYVVHTPRPEAIKAVRQVAGVSHYLSLMSGAEVDMHKCALYGVVIACIDEVTDELGEELHPTPITHALMGDPPYESLRIVASTNERAADDDYPFAVKEIANAQDRSLRQLDDISITEVEEITRLKGGQSARANLAFLRSDISTDEWALMDDFGFLMQMLDDYLDQPKDRANGLSTLFTLGAWDGDDLADLIDRTERSVRDQWGDKPSVDRFFNICRLHKRLGDVENKTPLSASHFAPGYL